MSEVTAPATTGNRVPFWPTLIVVLAAALMVALGVWQLDRRHEKAALKVLFAQNLDRPITAVPVFGAPRPELMFRRATGTCLSNGPATTRGGEDADGRTGYRMVVRCRTGAEGPGLLVDAGVGDDFRAPVAIPPGPVTGTLVPAPSDTSLLGRLTGHAPTQEAMLVLDRPAPGLRASARPDPTAIPDNHLAYAVQWFAFAFVALVIYGFALFRRARKAAGLARPSPPTRG